MRSALTQYVVTFSMTFCFLLQATSQLEGKCNSQSSKHCPVSSCPRCLQLAATKALCVSAWELQHGGCASWWVNINFLCKEDCVDLDLKIALVYWLEQLYWLNSFETATETNHMQLKVSVIIYLFVLAWVVWISLWLAQSTFRSLIKF